MLSSIIIILYCAAILDIIFLIKKNSIHQAKRPLAIAIIAIGLHGLLLFNNIYQTAIGLNLNFANSIALVTWLMCLWLIIHCINKPFLQLGLVLFPIAIASILLSLLLDNHLQLVTFANWELKLHIILSMFAYSTLGISTLLAIAISLQNYLLKHHHTNLLTAQFPALLSLEKLFFKVLLIGFMLLSIGLISGFLFLEDMFAQRVVHKTILSLCSWIMFAFLLIGHWKLGWRGGIATKMTLIGMILLLLAYFGSKMVIELILQ